MQKLEAPYETRCTQGIDREVNLSTCVQDKVSVHFQRLSPMWQYKSGDGKFLTESDLKPNKSLVGNATEKKPGWIQINNACEGKLWDIIACQERVIHTELGELTEWNQLEVS